MTNGEAIRISRDINAYTEQYFIFAAEVTRHHGDTEDLI